MAPRLVAGPGVRPALNETAAHAREALRRGQVEGRVPVLREREEPQKERIPQRR